MPLALPLRPRREAAFTLIELLAVALILALMATFVAPGFEVVRRRRLQSEAMQLAAQLEFARQRTVMTGVPHRVLLDLEQAAYRIEWLGGGDSAPPTAPPEYDVRGASPLPLSAPPSSLEEYAPIPGESGRFHALEDDLIISGLETPEGWLDRGQTFVSFDRDGTATYTEIVLEDDSGLDLRLAVYPLEDAVQLLQDEED